MVSRATIEVWTALGETAKLVRLLEEIPPCDRATAARKTLLRSCVAIRRLFADDPKALGEVLKDAQRTMLHLRKLRETEGPTIH